MKRSIAAFICCLAGDWQSVSIELARGEAESVYIGVHNIQGPPLIDTWAEPTIPDQDKLDVEVYFRDDEIHQLVPGKAIGRIPVGSTGGFWLTFSAGPDTPAGKHSIRLEIIPANHNRKKTIIGVDVNVRPFALPRARASFAGYYALSITGIPMGWVRYMNNARWREACYRNMAAYGMTDVDFRPLGPMGTEEGELLLDGEPNKGLARLDAELAMTNKAGLTDPETPVVILEGQTPKDTDALKAFAPKLVKHAKEKGWPEPLIYTRDEPPYPNPDVRPYNVPFIGTPLRTVTSMGIHAAYGHGDVIDVWLMYAGHITPELRAEAGRLGVEVWTYSCHIFGNQPIRNRFYAGLYTWAQDAGGNWIWAYYRNSFHSRLVWSESADYRMFPRVSYENRRDGIDDYRYLQMLGDAIAAKPDDPAAGDAREYLDALRARILDADPHKAAPGKPAESKSPITSRRSAPRPHATTTPGARRDSRMRRRRIAASRSTSALRVSPATTTRRAGQRRGRSLNAAERRRRLLTRWPKPSRTPRSACPGCGPWNRSVPRRPRPHPKSRRSCPTKTCSSASGRPTCSRR